MSVRSVRSVLDTHADLITVVSVLTVDTLLIAL